MKKIMMLMMIFVFAIAVHPCAATIVQYSTDNVTWFNATVDETSKTATAVNLTDVTKYYLRGKDDGTNWTYVSQTTEEGGRRGMISLALMSILIFIGALLSVALFFVKALWLQTILLSLIDLVVAAMFRLGSSLFSVAYPTEVNTLALLDAGYTIFIVLLIPLGAIAIFMSCYVAISELTGYYARKKERTNVEGGWQ